MAQGNTDAIESHSCMSCQCAFCPNNPHAVAKSGVYVFSCILCPGTPTGACGKSICEKPGMPGMNL